MSLTPSLQFSCFMQKAQKSFAYFHQRHKAYFKVHNLVCSNCSKATSLREKRYFQPVCALNFVKMQNAHRYFFLYFERKRVLTSPLFISADTKHLKKYFLCEPVRQERILFH